ncbi:hypothetical protein [Microbacterium testaceum]|uniref:hypothetical protein n=1 Tax=Microbacterium testaceum TaxID=2033 RepID=UPI0022E43B45|nr:hypothetical protein [Microbacterium testaceum]
MLGKLEDPTAAEPAATPAATEADLRPAVQLPANRPSRGDALRRNSTAAPTATGYRSYERKEARLRPDQYARLTEESRRLSRAKNPGGERITENTLIRIAIDLLLERSDQLAGTSEAELRKSVGL